MKKLLVMLLALLLALSMIPAATAEVAQEITYALANEPDGIDPSITKTALLLPSLSTFSKVW